jgi:two-component system, chemotaxis family, chemotaxis protein CheY
MSKSVLIVDDSMAMRAVINQVLVQGGYEVVGQASNGREAIDMAFDLQPDIITLDNILPDMVGTDILRALNKEGLESKVIMITGAGQDSVVKEGFSLGAKAFIQKPFKVEQLLDQVDKL